MTLLFFIVVLPVVFAAGVWIVVTALRILHPEEPSELIGDPDVMRRQRLFSGEVMMVGFRDIREQLKRSTSHRREDAEVVYLTETGYDYMDGSSRGLPEAWRRDLGQRMN